ncbi:MAG: YIP1 family protein [Streptococcaceae bacterium]|jgi:sugar lactone lactonase YvrE|nr:YIP1 family protein [Streptococcaceae bacterium]
MIKKVKFLLEFLVSLTILINLAYSSKVEADFYPYPSSILGTNNQIQNSQAAYQPLSVLTNQQFGKIADMKIVSDKIYIADSQNKVIYVINESGQILQTVHSPELQAPSGLAVDRTGNIYVADPVAKLVIKFDKAGQELTKYSKPTDPLFGKNSPYNPTKLAVDSRGELYIVGTGTTAGLMVLSSDGGFLGYFGGNQADQTLLQKMQTVFGSGFGLKNSLKNLAPAPTNVYLDASGIVYTSTNVATNQAVRKLNLAGQNMLPASANVGGAVAVTTDRYADIFILTSTGQIGEFDSNGNLLFVFGTRGDNGDQLGLFKNASAIAVKPDGTVVVADSETNLIQEFKTTSFADEVHAGVRLINNGNYNQAKAYFTEIVKKNNNFVLAYNSIANADLLQGNYKLAEANYKIAENKVGYSNAYWYIRQNWLDHNLGWTIFVLIVFLGLIQVFKQLHRRTQVLARFDQAVAKLMSSKFFDELRDLPRMIRHPLDTFYSFKREGRGTVRAANFWLMILLIEIGIYLVLTGYIFNDELVKEVSIFFILAVLLVSLLIFVLINYMVASITDGEGRLKTVYVSTVHSLAPIILLLLPTVLLTNILTLNEAFIIQYAYLIMAGWSILLLMLMVSKIHDFSLAGTLKNVFLTIFAIAIMLFTLYILWVLGGQLIDFIKAIVWEVTHHG